MIVGITLSLVPVLFFLAGLRLLDSFKLVPLSRVVAGIAFGLLAAVLSFAINVFIMSLVTIDTAWYSRLGAPLVEETMKSLYIAWLMHHNRIGFMVDGAIVGFATGTGFALCENIYYLASLHEATPVLWVVRGFGTAVMHGGSTAILAILAKRISERRAKVNAVAAMPGLAIAMIFHSLYNFSFLGAVGSTAVIILVVPPLLMFIFRQSEIATRAWLGIGFDADISVLATITEGRTEESNIGRYLQSLREHFSPEVVVDMLCLLRLHTELAVRAKGTLMMREAGFEVPTDPEVRQTFDEIESLKKQIGATGQLAIAPLLVSDSKDTWQLMILQD